MSEICNLYCRLCAEDKPTGKLLDLTTSDAASEDIVQKLSLLNAVIIDIAQEDVLPKTACFVCIDTLNKACDFVTSVQKAQVTLHNLFESNKIKSEVYDNSDDADDTDYDYDLDLAGVKSEGKLNVEVKVEFDDIDGPCTRRRKLKTKKTGSTKLKIVKTTSWRDYSWLCAYCGTQFPTVEELKNHSITYHESCTAYKCTDCNTRKLNLNAFLKHVTRHRKQLKLSCYVCGKGSSNSQSMKKHLMSHTKNAKHVCFACNTVFPDDDQLNEHVSKFLRDRRLKRFVENEDDTGNDPVCKICQKTFKTRGNLFAHMQIHSERRRDHTCEKCGKRFYNKGTLNSHMLLHEDARPFKCEICLSAFKTNTQLRSHVGIHGGSRPYSCEQCGRCFRLRRHLNSHLIIHTDSLPHICEYCSKAFRFKTILTQHLRQHTGAKPYTCEQCNRDFTNWPNYNKHMKRRHGTDMSKKKHTPDGVFPVNPLTGEIQVLPTVSSETDEWRKKLMAHRKPGRPRINHEEEDTKPDVACLQEDTQDANVCTSVG